MSSPWCSSISHKPIRSCPMCGGGHLMVTNDGGKFNKCMSCQHCFGKDGKPVPKCPSCGTSEYTAVSDDGGTMQVCARCNKSYKTNVEGLSADYGPLDKTIPREEVRKSLQSIANEETFFY